MKSIDFHQRLALIPQSLLTIHRAFSLAHHYLLSYGGNLSKAPASFIANSGIYKGKKYHKSQSICWNKSSYFIQFMVQPWNWHIAIAECLQQNLPARHYFGTSRSINVYWATANHSQIRTLIPYQLKIEYKLLYWWLWSLNEIIIVKSLAQYPTLNGIIIKKFWECGSF